VRLCPADGAYTIRLSFSILGGSSGG